MPAPCWLHANSMLALCCCSMLVTKSPWLPASCSKLRSSKLQILHPARHAPCYRGCRASQKHLSLFLISVMP
ncbi:hypothetical protein AOQ84DRAFT_355015 [Glonium stellatum]|uniref:Secreted protein n=1 Tax=Glonium stellatum TaxID=574774 RepID=A0A8E2EZD7_9PEZI|nr:hypothetical protein AOQ84DRAFT_355015 [Glonium stellatum]